MDRDMSNRKGFFQPGTNQNIVLKKKPTVAEVLSNIAVETGSVQSSTANANTASQVAQKISVQKETAVKEAAAAQQKTVAAQNNAPKFGRFAREDITAYNNAQAAKAAAKTASAIKTSQVNNTVIGGNTGASETAYYDVDPTLNAMYKEAVAQGVKVNAPTVYGQSVKTEAAAKAAQQTYIDYLDKQYAAYNSAQPVTVYDDLGRSQSISQTQLAQMEKAQQTRKSSGTYTVLPEEVANSKANWWINSNGLYEWAPVTAGDKAELARQNKQRAQFHQAPKTTLTCGASPSEEYSAQWYSTGGNRTQVARNAKLATLKASSSTNNSASAKSGTAQTKKATVVSAAATAKQQAAAQAKRKVEAAQAAETAKKAEALAAQTKLEAAAKAKQLTVARAELKKAVSTADKTAAQKTVKTLEKESTAAKNASKAASSHAKATSELASATKTAASTSVKKTPTVINAVNKAQAKVEKTAAASKKAGVQDHSGQILLKDGTWINSVQKKGLAGKGESAVKVFGTTKEYQKQLAADYKNKLAGKSTPHTLSSVYAKGLTDSRRARAEEVAVAKQLAAAYVPILTSTGEVIDAVQSKSLRGTGEAGVRVIKLDKNNNIVAASKTAKQFSDEKKLYTKAVKVLNSDGSTSKTTLDKLSITPQTNKATAKLIQEARAYKLAHISNANKFNLQLEYAGLDGEFSAPKSKTSLKTVDQIKQEKLIKSSNNKITKSLVKADIAFKDALSYKNVTKKASNTLDSANKKFSGWLNLPTLASAAAARDQFLKGITIEAPLSSKKINLLDSQRVGQKAIYNNKYSKATMDLMTDTYDSVRTKPVSAGLKVVELYATGMIAGVAIEGGLGLAASGAARVATKTASKVVKKAATTTARHVQGAGRATLGVGVGVEGLKTLRSGDAAKTVNFAASLAIGNFGYSKGAKIAKDPISIIPHVKTVKLQTKPEGASSVVSDIAIGETFSIRGKPILSRSYEGKIMKGALKVPEGKIRGKEIQAFDDLGVKAVEKSLNDLVDTQAQKRFKSGKVIADAVYRQNTPVTKPSKFKIASRDIPEVAKPVVEKTIRQYSGPLNLRGYQVYGSATQKLQMDGYFSRTPKDLEISVGSVNRFVSTFRKNATKAGLKEGIDYNVNAIVSMGPFKTKAEALNAIRTLKTEKVEKIYPMKKSADGYTFDYKGSYTKARGGNPKIEFKIGDRWEKGVEVFSHSSKIDSTTGYSGTGSSRLEEGIAWGFKSKKSEKISKIKAMSLPEQGARKFEGSMVLKNRDFVPKHEGREKDIRDLIEIGTAYELTRGLGISKAIIDHAELSSERFSSLSESPIAAFIANKHRLPTKAEIDILLSSGNLSEKEVNTVLKFKKAQQKTVGSTVQKHRALRSAKMKMNEKPIGQPKKSLQKTSTKTVNNKNKITKTAKNSTLQRRFRNKNKSNTEKDLIFKNEELSTRVAKELKDVSKSLSSKGASRRASLKIEVSKSTSSRKTPSMSIHSKAAVSKAVSSRKTPSRSTNSKTVASKTTISRKTPSRSTSSKTVKSKTTISRKTPSRSTHSKIPPSKITISRKAPSKVPSKTPSKRPSNVPSKVPSKGPSGPSKTSSKTSSSSSSSTSSSMSSSTSKRSSSSNSDYWYLPAKTRRRDIKLPGIKKGATKKKVKVDRLKFHRNIKNILGSMESFFGDSSLKKAPARARSTKTTTKKRTAAKRGKR